MSEEDVAGLRLVLVNVPPAAANDVARGLVERRLAACVNVVPGVTSFYRWEGKLTEDSECTLLVKTRAALMEELTRAVKELHPYTVPEVIALPIQSGEGNADYLQWVLDETRR